MSTSLDNSQERRPNIYTDEVNTMRISNETKGNNNLVNLDYNISIQPTIRREGAGAS